MNAWPPDHELLAGLLLRPLIQASRAALFVPRNADLAKTLRPAAVRRTTPKVKLPNAHRAHVAEEKVRDYLLAPANPRARGKAAFFHALGFQSANWEALREALLEMGRTGGVSVGQQSEFGAKFEIRGSLSGPNGRTAVINTIWIVESDDDQPRLVTAYPD